MKLFKLHESATLEFQMYNTSYYTKLSNVVFLNTYLLRGGVIHYDRET